MVWSGFGCGVSLLLLCFSFLSFFFFSGNIGGLVITCLATVHCLMPCLWLLLCLPIPMGQGMGVMVIGT